MLFSKICGEDTSGHVTLRPYSHLQRARPEARSWRWWRVCVCVWGAYLCLDDLVVLEPVAQLLLADLLLFPGVHEVVVAVLHDDAEQLELSEVKANYLAGLILGLEVHLVDQDALVGVKADVFLEIAWVLDHVPVVQRNSDRAAEGGRSHEILP